MSEFSTRRVAGLDLIRSVAILLVVTGHYWPFWQRFASFEPINWGGYFGVEPFFVLSGFLIGGILLRQAEGCTAAGGSFGLGQAPHFWLRRWFRTLPNYVLFFGVYLLYHQPWKFGEWRAWLLSAFFLQNLFVDLSHGIYGISWSLCVEEWMYLLLPLLLAGFTRRAKTPARAALWAILTHVALPTALRCATSGQAWDVGVRHVVVYRLDAIGYGVLLAYLRQYHREFFARLGRPWMAFAGTAALLGQWGLLFLHAKHTLGRNPDLPEEHWFLMNVFCFSCTSLAAIPLVAWASGLARVPAGLQTLVYRTSLYSYAMYLCHPVVLYLADPALNRLADRTVGQFRGLTFLLAFLGLGVIYAASAAVYHLWEGPLTGLRERFAPTLRARPLSPDGTKMASPASTLSFPL